MRGLEEGEGGRLSKRVRAPERRKKERASERERNATAERIARRDKGIHHIARLKDKEK